MTEMKQVYLEKNKASVSVRPLNGLFSEPYDYLYEKHTMSQISTAPHSKVSSPNVSNLNETSYIQPKKIVQLPAGLENFYPTQEKTIYNPIEKTKEFDFVRGQNPYTTFTGFTLTPRADAGKELHNNTTRMLSRTKSLPQDIKTHATICTDDDLDTKGFFLEYQNHNIEISETNGTYCFLKETDSFTPTCQQSCSSTFQSPSSCTVLNRARPLEIDANLALKTLLNCITHSSSDYEDKPKTFIPKSKDFKKHNVTFSDIVCHQSPGHVYSDDEIEASREYLPLSYSTISFNYQKSKEALEDTFPIVVDESQQQLTAGAATAPAAMISDPDAILSSLLETIAHDTLSSNPHYPPDTHISNKSEVIIPENSNFYNTKVAVDRTSWCQEEPTFHRGLSSVTQNGECLNTTTIEQSPTIEEEFMVTHIGTSSYNSQYANHYCQYTNPTRSDYTYTAQPSTLNRTTNPFIYTRGMCKVKATKGNIDIYNPLPEKHLNQNSYTNPESILWKPQAHMICEKAKIYEDDRDRMVYVSWIPKRARAHSAVEKRKMELELKQKLREHLSFTTLTKVLLFPPKGVHCKLIFNSSKSAATFIEIYGGDNHSLQTEKWKQDLCRIYDINMRDKIDKTVVKIEWSQK